MNERSIVTSVGDRMKRWWADGRRDSVGGDTPIQVTPASPRSRQSAASPKSHLVTQGVAPC
jgi:hypothetical protein